MKLGHLGQGTHDAGGVNWKGELCIGIKYIAWGSCPSLSLRDSQLIYNNLF